MQNYVVIRISVQTNGKIAAPVNAYDTEDQAWRQYFTLCSQAVTSSYPMDSVVIMTKEGFQLEKKTFEHEVAEPAAE